MKNKFHRRSFLSLMSLGLSSLLALPFFSSTRTIKKLQKEMSDSNNTNAIIKIRPLGFQWETLDPFLFCVHHEDKYPNGNSEMGPDASLSGRHIGQDFVIKDGWRMYHGSKVPGFPGHPHRGFETITVVREGLVDHADSMGASGRYGNGDVQWMTSGRGVQHSEMFPLMNLDKSNPMELFQIWLNLPSKSKMVDPHFKMLWAEEIPVYSEKDKNGNKTSVEIMAGSFSNKTPKSPPPNSWAFPNDNHVAVWNIEMEKGASFTLPKTESGVNRTLYYYKGSNLSINANPIAAYHAVDVQSDQDLILESGNTITKILVLQGKPIGEPVVQHGPFVMNTREEIQQTFADYQKDEFGGWPWETRDQVHDRSKGRFAKHADGRVEEKS
jgi:redox-sensitive bicupin YhaK (pirin superfamily)